ncbi:hypothetical protein Poli38472_013119 [Pythium oligandrum]|uniref:Protein kinase domain-containing protein n=1 Tax=Pythium oligandrum TaxID=41045 RepID=A0A8K1FDU7_PYTOL|nr:hypothetical protein Poli38472_013119 [Pythium oligandrum]|eukprot:TMW55228.1 hypothetical protein Poli38472_013119 [Pythium oligandrum]
MTSNPEVDLFEAAFRGDVASVKSLLEGGVDVNAVNKVYETALHLASANGHVKAVEVLLDQGADVFDRKNRNRMTALHYAAINGHVRVVKQLLATSSDNVDVENNIGQTALHLAVVNKNADVVRALLEDGKADVDASSVSFKETQDNNQVQAKQTALHVASETGQRRMVELLLQYGANVNKWDENGSTALHLACANNHASVVKVILKTAVVDVNAPARKNPFLTPLQKACSECHDDVVWALLNDRRVQLNVAYNKDGWTPLHLAVSNRKQNIVNMLLTARGVNLNATGEWRKTGQIPDEPEYWVTVKRPITPLHLAVQCNYAEMVDAIVGTKGVDVNAEVEEHYVEYYQSQWEEIPDINRHPSPGTALHMAVEDSKTAVVEALLRAECVDVNAVHAEGWTALLRAAEKGSDPIVSALLIREDIDATVANQNGWTSLHYASANGNLKVVNALLRKKDAKCLVDARDSEGKTPLHRASECFDQSPALVVKALLAVMGDKVNDPDKEGNTALHLASLRGNVDVVRELIAMDEMLVNAQNGKGETALHLAPTKEIAEQLINRADLGISDTGGNTPLHFFSWRHQSAIVALSVTFECDVNARNKDGETPLDLCLRSVVTRTGDYHASVENVLETVFELMSHDGVFNQAFLPKTVRDSRGSVNDHAAIISICVQHWLVQRQNNERSLNRVPSEIIKDGSEAVETYLKDLRAGGVWRRKVCVVGSSGVGKTSLVTSITSMTPTLVDAEDHTIGVDLLQYTFVEEGIKRREHEVTFWDFAGQDEYHVAHTLFFSRRTLYLLCVDVEKFDREVREAEACETEKKAESKMQSFVEEHVWRWVRLIFARQPDAQFVLIATKADALGDNSNTHMKKLEARLIAILNEFRRRLAEELERTINASSKPSGRSLPSDGERTGELQTLQDQLKRFPTTWVPVNICNLDSIRHARSSIEQEVIKSDRCFFMGDKYSRVLKKVQEWRSTPKGSTKDQIEGCFVSVSRLRQSLMADIHDLLEDEATSILKALHNLGDVLWYARDGHDMLGDTVILDASLLINFIREVVCHDPKKIARTKTTNDSRIEALLEEMNRNGKVAHELLRYEFSLWSQLAYPEQLLQLKQLLQHFNLAYPAGGGKMEMDSDLIVPAYWRSYSQPTDITKLERLHFSDAEQRYHWEYDLGENSSELVKTVFEQLAVRSYFVFPDRAIIRGQCIESISNGKLAIRIACGLIGERGPGIRLEVIGELDQNPSVWLRGVHKAIEEVLVMFPGILVTRYALVIDRFENIDVLIQNLRNTQENLRAAKLRECKWLPDGVDHWFRRTDEEVWFISPDSIQVSSAFAEGSPGTLAFTATWLNSEVVVKVVKETEIHQFVDEVKLWHGLRHPNVVPFYGANHQEEPYFIVSMYASNHDLVPYLRGKQPHVVWQKLVEVAAGLSYLHNRGIVHGDLKGNNIVVSKDGTAMLVDFGMSFYESGSSSAVDEKKNSLGAMAWRAPEFVTDAKTLTTKSDVYSLGMCIIQAVTLNNPWGSYTNDAIRENLGRGIIKVDKPEEMTNAQWKLVQQMIAPSPNDRPELDEIIPKLTEFANDAMCPCKN